MATLACFSQLLTADCAATAAAIRCTLLDLLIQQEQARNLGLENVPEHRAIVEMWERLI